ncbi:MAG: glycosyltransferase family 4 protein [Anaerolineales bacterium]|nr:glycosyltransferase family 4 protein [Anaerolineales bacterium]
MDPNVSYSTADKLLFLDHAPALGGAERSLLLILAGLQAAGWQPHLACSAGELAAAAPLPAGQVHSISLPCLRRSPLFLWDWWRQARQIAALARQLQAPLYANTVRAALYAAPAARLARQPFIWHMRDFWLSEGPPRWPGLERALKARLCRAATAVIANSHATAAALPCLGKVTVIHNALDLKTFSEQVDSQAFRQQFKLPANAPLVGMLGRLRPWKGQDRFLRAMSRVAAALPEARFLIGGGAIFDVQDDYAASLQRLVNHLGLQERVVFTGQLADVRPALAAMDVFVHPGDPEPFGLVNIEAMAMARPVVAFNHGALPEIVVHGQTGLLVPPGDEHALAAAVLELLQDPECRAAMGAAGRQRVEKHFTVARMVAEIEAVLQEVLAA